MDYNTMVQALLEILELDALPPIVEKQLNTYCKLISHKQILRAVYYYFVVKKNDLNSIKQYGIGFVQWTYEEADTFFEQEKSRLERLEAACRNLKDPEIVLIENTMERKVDKLYYDIAQLTE